MIQVHIAETASSAAAQTVRLAGRRVAFDHRLPELSAFPSEDGTGTDGLGVDGLGEDCPEEDLAEVVPWSVHSGGSPASPGWVHAGPGVLSGRDIAVISRFHPRSGYAIELADGLRLRIAADGGGVRWMQPVGRSCDDALMAECVLGPGLLMALALRGTYALHASAVAWNGRAVAFLGQSGAGKSTLAALLGALDGPWRRVGDDVLPVTMDAAGPATLPRYPQLKLAPDEQAHLLHALPERLPLAALYVLADPSAPADPLALGDGQGGAGARAGTGDGVATYRLSSRDASLELLAQTLAARLFAPDLTARHLSFCADLASAVPVRVLVYPHRMDIAAEVAGAIVADLAVEGRPGHVREAWMG